MVYVPKNINEIVEKYNLKLLVYFGSYGTEYYNNESDIDIAYLSDNDLSFEEKISLLEDLIKFHKKSEIDLVDLKSAEPILRFEIAKNGRAFYEKEDNLFERYSLFYIKRIYELRPIKEEHIRQIGLSIEEVLSNV